MSLINDDSIEFCYVIDSQINCNIKEIFINSNNGDIEELLTYKNDTLNVFLHKPIDYHTIRIEFDQSDNSELYIEYIHSNLSISIISNQQYIYDFNIEELLELTQWFNSPTILKPDLSHLKSVYVKKKRQGFRTEFNGILILNIKKALIK